MIDSLASADSTRITHAPDETLGEPLHRRVTATLARQIERGELRAGAMLPPELELARRFGVSRHTMRAGLDALVRQGLLERRRGKGTVVREPPISQSLDRFYSLAQEMGAHGTELRTQVIARGRLDPADPLAGVACERLGITDPDDIGYLLRLRLVQGSPLILETLTFPASLCLALLDSPTASTDDPAAGSFYDALKASAGLRVAWARETFRPVAVTGYEARLLGVPSGTPVFAVERTSYADGRAVEWRRSLARGDRYVFAVELRNPDDEGGSVRS
ncbi:MAG TPA: GntR family transcriptional regulator [Ktedonobacterales bacterium]|nr:GntR family transcriptional regulator [Ktedonobacterales bacterium]